MKKITKYLKLTCFAVFLLWIAAEARTYTMSLMCYPQESALIGLMESLLAIDRNMNKTYRIDPNGPDKLVSIKLTDYINLTGDINTDGRVDPNDRALVIATIQPAKADPNVPIPPPAQETMVYVTASGTSYHKAGCRYVTATSTQITLSQAQASGKRPCSSCFK